MRILLAQLPQLIQHTPLYCFFSTAGLGLADAVRITDAGHGLGLPQGPHYLLFDLSPFFATVLSFYYALDDHANDCLSTYGELSF